MNFEITIATERKRIPQVTPSEADQAAFDAAVERLSALKSGRTARLAGAANYRTAFADALGDGFEVKSATGGVLLVKRSV